MQGDADGQILVNSSDNSTWEGGEEKAAMDHNGHGEWAPELPDILFSKGETAEMPRGGVPRESDDKDGNAGALCAPACPRHRGDPGGRKLPPPTVHPVRHAGPPEGAEQEVPGDHAVPQGSGKEYMATGRDIDKGELGAGV